MSSQIDDLVKMQDTETLHELMAEHENWVTQLDAAEGLVRLSDRRGLEFLLGARQSEDREIRDAAREILEDSAAKRMFDQIKAEERRARQEKLEIARKRLESGKKVFQYKMVFLPTGELLDEDPQRDGFYIPGLIESGLEGWEVVSVIPRRGQLQGGSLDEYIPGAYFLMKREIARDQAGELE